MCVYIYIYIYIFHHCSSWLNRGSLPGNLNDIVIALIPKCGNPFTMCDLRPISLCNVEYKILAKELANMLKKVIWGYISKEQAVFMANRSIQKMIW